MGCGSTIGPILAAGLGCKTVDVGAPQLSMHSIREMCGVDDIKHSYRHFMAFFKVTSLLPTRESELCDMFLIGKTSPLPVVVCGAFPSAKCTLGRRVTQLALAFSLEGFPCFQGGSCGDPVSDGA